MSSTKTQSTPPLIPCTISSIAAMPMSFTEQHRQPFGKLRNDSVRAWVVGSFSVNAFSARQPELPLALKRA